MNRIAQERGRGKGEKEGDAKRELGISEDLKEMCECKIYIYI